MRALFGCLSVSLVGWVCALNCGCAGPNLASHKMMASPLSVEQQQQEVLKVAPLNTPRAEVERRLKAAGIDVSSGASPSIAYCDSWNRKDGSRWRMDVALLFDANDQLYATKQANAETRVGGSEPLKGRTAAGPARTERNQNSGADDASSDPPMRSPVVGNPFTGSRR